MKMIQPCALFKVYSGFVTDTTVETIQKEEQKKTEQSKFGGSSNCTY